MLRPLALALALYLLSCPDSAAQYTPGFQLLASLVPRSYPLTDQWGAILLLPCVLHRPALRQLLECRILQYLGTVSFSFYLIHGPVLHGLGFWIMPRLFELLGRPWALGVGWLVQLVLSLYFAGWWSVKIHSWSVSVGKRIATMWS